MVLKEMGCEGADRIHLALGRVQYLDLVNTIMNIQVPQNGDNF